MKIYVKAIITLMLIVTALNVMTEISVFSCSEKGELVSYDSASLQETEYNTKDIAASYLDDEVIVQRAIDDILGQVEPQMSTVEKILAVHDYICLHYEYDYTYNIYDAKNFFLNKTGVCAAYSEAFKQIMNELNINCKIVRSSAMNHDWNLVEIDGKWYHIDLTSDDTADGNYGYTKHMYFLLSDTAIKEMGHHSWNQTFAADSDIYDDFFWRKTNLPIQYYDGNWYWYGVSENNGVSKKAVLRYNFSDNSNVGIFYDQIYAMGIFDDNIYFLDQKWNICKVPLDSPQNITEVINDIPTPENCYSGIGYFENNFYRYNILCPDDDTTTYQTIDLLNNTVSWTYEDGVLTVSSDTGIIPDYSDSPAPWEEYSSMVQSIIVDDGIKKIGKYAFYNFTSLTRVRLPEGLTSIGAGAFENCTGLTEIIIPDKVSSIGIGVFSGCSSLERIELPREITYIGSRTFKKCIHLLSISIPNGVVSIGKEAFSYCSKLQSVSLSESVISIASLAFMDCSSLKEITMPKYMDFIGNSAFLRCNSLERIAIPYGVTVIEENTFTSCHSLSSVTIPSSVISISHRAFDTCKSLSAVYIPSSVTDIGINAFYNCISLKSISMGNGVADVKAGAFANCYELTDIYYSGSDEEWAAITIGDNNEWLTDAYIHTTTGKSDIQISNITENKMYRKIWADFKNNTKKTQVFDAVCAIYDKNGVLIDCEIKTLTENPGEEKKVLFFYGYNWYSYKIFAWDSSASLKPLCQSVNQDEAE